jgi:crotonobetainyl-CoA:carnitine CoA-transferase CaiB-like acyl-CoA transferase
MFGEIDQAEIGRILSPRAPLAFSRNATLPPSASPGLGQDAGNVLRDLLGLSPAEIRRFQERGVLGGSLSGSDVT